MSHYHGERYSNSIDDPDRLNELAGDFYGGIWTDRIDLLGPAVESGTYHAHPNAGN